MTYRRLVLPAAIALLVAACGGGGGGDDSSGTPPVGGNPPPVASPPPGGSQKTVFVTGAIDGFGSVIVHGVRYDTSGTEVRIDDRPGTVAELRVGHVIRLQAKVDDRGQARAERIEQEHLLRGTVQSVDVPSGMVVVAGQRVRVDDDTSFDDSIRGGSMADIIVGERIEVHGFSTSNGEARATRLEKPDAGEVEVEVTGLVAGLDTVARRFRVGTLVVDYSVAVLEDFGTAGLREGDLVEVKGRSILADGTLQATRVKKDDDDPHGVAGGEAEVEGLVTRFVSPEDFSVGNQRVKTTAATVFVGGSAADLRLDTKVEAEGRLDSNGVLVATKVAFKRAASIELAAPVEDVQAADGTLRALGLTIVVGAATRREDKSGDDRTFGLDDLRVGDWIEVRGYPDPSGTGRVIATRLERDDAEDEVELRGPADAMQAPRFRILGVNIETTSGTQFEDEDVRIDAATFFARAGGQTVEVEGSWNNALLVARKAEIEREDDGRAPPVSTPPVNPPPAPPPPVTPPPVTPPVTPPLDGAALYASNCASCHGAITAIRSLPVSNRNAADFRRAISNNRGGMGFLATLTDEQLQAIANAIRAANP